LNKAISGEWPSSDYVTIDEEEKKALIQENKEDAAKLD